MNTIMKDVLANAPAGLTKVQIAQWIHAKYPMDWGDAHYHAMQCVIARVENRIKEQFIYLIGVEPDELSIRKLFENSLSDVYDFVCNDICVERSKESFISIINQNLQISQ